MLKKFNQEIKLFNDLKKRGMIDNKITFEKYREDKNRFNQKNDRVKVLSPQAKLKEIQEEVIKKENSWKKVKMNELKNISINTKLQDINPVKEKPKVKVVEYNPYLSRLTELEYKYAKQDY